MLYGGELKEWRRAAGYSQAQFARYIGVAQRTVSCWEIGRNFARDKTAEAAREVIEAFDIYGPGSYAWECADLIEAGYMTVERALKGAPTTYKQDELRDWLECQEHTAKFRSPANITKNTREGKSNDHR